MMDIILKSLDFLWGLLPSRLKVQFIQNQYNFGFLDTPKKRIKLRLESIDTLNRLDSCRKEPETIQWLESNITKGDVLFDVGANVGAYSLYAAAVIGAKVCSFEPSPSTFRLLLENIYINGLSQNIVPFNIPLSSKTGLQIFTYNRLDSGAASHTGLEPSNQNVDEQISQPVLTLTLDDLVFKYDIQPPNHLKIDVDGHEFEILKGATRVLSSVHLKSVQIELSNSDKNYSSIVKKFQEHNFKIYRINKHPHTEITDIVFKK